MGGRVLQWRLILGNIERLLKSWSEADGGVTMIPLRLAEDIAYTLNIDRAWPLFKIVAHAECPLGGIVIAALLHWRCLSGNWGLGNTHATARLFTAMERQLPLVALGPPRNE